MAIAFDAATDGGQTGGFPASITFSHTCTGSDRILFVSAIGNAASVLLMSNPTVTYNGVSMTLIGSQVGTGNTDKVFVYYLIAPATGANNVVITQGVTTIQFLSGLCESFTGLTTQTSAAIIDSGGTADGSGGSLTITKTLAAAGHWGVIFASGQSNLEAGTNITERIDTTTAYYAGDTAGTLGSGSQSIAVTIASNNGGAYGVFFGIPTTAYTITATQGSYTLTGQASNLLRPVRNMVAALGTFTLTGQDVTFRSGKGIIAATGYYVLTGIAAMLRRTGWANQTKHTSSYGNQTKHSSSWTNQTKHN